MNDSPEISWGGITADEIRETWEGQLRSVPAELIAPVVTPHTRRLLVEVGLPTAEVLGIDFAFGDQLSSVARQGGREYLVVTGDRSHVPFAVDVRTDQVFEFDRSDPRYTRFFNSDLAVLLLFLGQLWRALKLEEVAAIKAAIGDTRTSLTKLDPTAMEASAPWKLLLDDLESQIE